MQAYLGFFESFGWAFVFLGCLLEGEFCLVATGYAIAAGSMSVWEVVPLAWAGAFVGDLLAFHAGTRWGEGLVSRWPWLKARLPRVRLGLMRYGFWALLLLRFQIAMRILGCILVATAGIDRRRFLKSQLIATLIWAAAITWFCVQLAPIWDWMIDFWRAGLRR